MKVKFKAVILLCVSLGVSFLSAQTSSDTKAEAPHHSNFVDVSEIDIRQAIPLPPAPDSLAAAADLETLLRVQASRTADQVAYAKMVVNDSAYMYAPILGSWFTAQNLPLTSALIEQVEQDANGLSGRLKVLYKRTRPFLLSADVKPCVIRPKTDSYPSGHTYRAYVRAAVLAELFPEKRAALFDEAHKIAWARVVGGVHFPTDTAGGRILAESFLKELLKNPKFIDQVNKARAEAAPFLLKKAA